MSTRAVAAELDAGVRLGYRPALDGLRALAVTVVVLYHYWYIGGPRDGLGTHLPGGFLGVDVFFVLSGFLITRLLLEEAATTRGHIGLRSFYRRRFARLAPGLLVLLATVLVLALTTGVWPDGRRAVVEGAAVSAAYAANWFWAHHRLASVFGPLWSLSVEEQFYLVWPLLVVWAHRRGGVAAVRRIAAVLFAAAFVDSAVRTAMGGSTMVSYGGTDTHGLLVLMAGALVASSVGLGELERIRHPRLLAAAGVAGLVVLAAIVVTMSSDGRRMYPQGLCVVSVATVAVVLAALRPGRLSAALSQRHLVAVGRLSYSLYLWHYPVKLAAVHVADSIAVSTTVARLAGLVVSVGAAAASYRFVEQPLRRRWATARPRPVTVPATIATVPGYNG